MMKLVGAALLLMSCTAIGFRIARDYRERPRQIRILMQAIRLLKQEIEFSVTPLPQALSRVALRTVPPVSKLMEAIASNLGESDVSVPDAFSSSLQDVKAYTAFRSQDVEVLQEFGETLGTSDRVHQSQHFAAVLTQLDGLEREAREAQKRNERLWQYLGVLTGLLLLVLLY
ncbi:stage III sporulation protein SpoIIIAB [Alicyclobacillus sp. SO9]|uniref:stage III sporulation protein SpoIIIAB n=1 Tax=Alicyclobacillus sp. SO9 TaxID=2665646 RepID=UPI0018E755F5|nr:stage III sporulation protein SpoIIIAB [Alicyclobacillus sp. SO9]QQE76980.1 stage III sporulation protein AB [Alicyclobacillus sp. SO9]